MIRFSSIIFLYLYLIVQCYCETLLSTGIDVSVFVNSQIDEHDVMVFAKSYCPYCKRTKAVLMEMSEKIDTLDVEFIDLNLLPNNDGPIIQNYLLQITEQRTVPNIFIGQQHVGGNSDLQQLSAIGQLEIMLIEASTGGTEL